MTDAPRSCFDRPAFTSRVVPVIVLTDAAQAGRWRMRCWRAAWT
jgi:hypothetical protein